jgi:hypothetical protein
MGNRQDENRFCLYEMKKAVKRYEKSYLSLFSKTLYYGCNNKLPQLV